MFEPAATRGQVLDHHRHATRVEPVATDPVTIAPIVELVRTVTTALGHTEPSIKAAILAVGRDPEQMKERLLAAAKRLGIPVPEGLE